MISLAHAQSLGRCTAGKRSPTCRNLSISAPRNLSHPLQESAHSLALRCRHQPPPPCRMTTRLSQTPPTYGQSQGVRCTCHGINTSSSIPITSSRWSQDKGIYPPHSLCAIKSMRRTGLYKRGNQSRRRRTAPTRANKTMNIVNAGSVVFAQQLLNTNTGFQWTPVPGSRSEE